MKSLAVCVFPVKENNVQIEKNSIDCSMKACANQRD